MTGMMQVGDEVGHQGRGIITCIYFLGELLSHHWTLLNLTLCGF